MLLLAHTGITLGLALGGHKVFPELLTRRPGNGSHKAAATLRDVATHIDYRLIVIGSMLPDIIDKPLGYWIVPSLENGRTFCHTLIFFLVLVTIGTWLHRRGGRTAFMFLAFGSGIHLALDQMWYEPETLLWPFLGTSLYKRDPVDFVEHVKENLLHDSLTYIPEIIGFIILVGIGLFLLRRAGISDFLRNGAI